MELDGVAASISSCAGVSSASAMLVDNELWGFFAPGTIDVGQVRKAVDRDQPYYARPQFYVTLGQMPLTA